jgi:hypothetical protein
MVKSLAMKKVYALLILFLIVAGCTSNQSLQPLQMLELRSVTVASNGAAQLLGRVTINEGSDVGVVYATKPQPTIADTKVSFGTLEGVSLNIDRNISGTFAPNTKVYFRLYATKNNQTTYSNEGVYYNSPRWQRLPDINYEGNPMPEATLIITLEGMVYVQPRRKSYSLQFNTKTLDSQEQTGRSWNYFVSFSRPSEWYTFGGQDGASRIVRNPFSLSTIILDAGYNPVETLRGMGGGGYYYVPQLYPPFIYQKTFVDNVGPREPYPGADVKTISGAIGKIFPELFILEVGSDFALWNFTRRRGDTPKWVRRSSFPYKTSSQLAMFNTQENLYVLVQDASLLYRFSPATNTWTQMKKTPFAARQKGIGFSFEDAGYYGLGYNAQKGESYRDIWKYNEANDTWEYVTEYPGTGTADVAVAGGYDYLFLGLGFQTVPTPIGTMQVYPASDVWQFKL